MFSSRLVLDTTDKITLVVLTIVSAWTRLWQLSRLTTVTWDEAHFGRFGLMYLNQTFIHDVHPPLGKMVIAVCEHLTGFDAQGFDFASGAEYPGGGYTMLRALIAVFGIVTPHWAYLTMRRRGRTEAILAMWFVIFENALCLMSRLVVLDGMLVCLTAMSFMARGSPLLVGVLLGLTVSVKWVGVCSFVPVLASLVDTARRRSLVLFLARSGLALAIIPAIVYVGLFGVHYRWQTVRGYGEHTMPREFQANLRSNRYNRMPSNVAYGSIAKLETLTKTKSEERGRLFAVVGRPAGYGEVMTGADWWVFDNPSTNTSSSGGLEFIKDGSVVRLVSDLWKKPLDINSGGGVELAAGNETARWAVEIVRQGGTSQDKYLHPLTTVFRLRHQKAHCTLSLNDSPYNSKNNENSDNDSDNNNNNNNSSGSNNDTNTAVGTPVVCDGKSTLWRVEYHVHLAQGFDSNLRGKVPTSFFKNFVWQNTNMLKMNQELVLDPDRYDVLASAPWSWPLLIYPMRMTMWTVEAISRHSVVVYEIGNPVLWWASTLACVVRPIRFLVRIIKTRRKAGVVWEYYRDPLGSLLWLAWLTHYLLFFAIGRVTYLHHYLPALYFALLLLALELGSVAKQQRRRGRWMVMMVMATMLAVFAMFAPCTFGWRQRGTTDLAHLRWLPSWNIAGSKYDAI